MNRMGECARAARERRRCLFVRRRSWRRSAALTLATHPPARLCPHSNTHTHTAGLSKRLEGGAVTKVKLDNSGLVSVLYEQDLRGRTKMAVSSQFNALDLNAKPKFGFGYDIK